MDEEEKKKTSEVSEYFILPYTQKRKHGNLGKCSFTSNFESCYNLRFRKDKNELRQKLKVIKWIKKKKRKPPRFSSFRFCCIPKIENSEISESVLLLQIFTEIVKHCVLWLLILRHIFPVNFIKVPHVVQKIWRFSRSILIFSLIFLDFLRFP